MKVELENGEAIIADDVRRAGGFLERLRGLMYTRELPRGKGLILEPCNSIHTFGMRFAIDVLFIDASNRVLKAIRSLKPGNIAGPVKNSTAVLELAAGELPENVELEGKKLRFIE